MVTQVEVVGKILADLGTGKLTLADAVAKAEATKPLKNKNKIKNWENHFKSQGVVVDGVVTAKVVAPVVTEPVVTPVVAQ